MAEVPGSIGTSSSLSLRLGQTLLSAGSILFMGIDLRFYRYTAFCYLVMIMALAVPWSLALAVVDVYYLLQKKKGLRNPRIILTISIADWVLSVLELGAAASTAGVVDFIRSEETIFVERICNRYQFSAILAFLTWFLSLSSFLLNLLLLPSL